MKKKLLIANIVIITLFLICYFFSFTIYNYPISFRYSDTIEYTDWAVLLYILLLIPFVASLLALFLLKRRTYFIRLLIFTLILGGSAFIYIFGNITISYCKRMSLLKARQAEYINEALADIKKDQIKVMIYGLQFPIYTEEGYRKIDSIYKENGLVKTANCIIDELDIEARKSYQEITDQYLEKRNGKDWKKHIKQELNKIKNNPNYKSKMFRKD